jgi:hypothetical protein
MIIRRLSVLTLALVSLAAPACNGITDPSRNATETFSGSVQPNNIGPVHQFPIANSGELTVSVTSIVPGSTFLGLIYGQLSGTACGQLQQAAVSSANLGKTALTAQLTNKGTYCVQAVDPSHLNLGLPALTVGQNYTLTVSHP